MLLIVNVCLAAKKKKIVDVCRLAETWAISGRGKWFELYMMGYPIISYPMQCLETTCFNNSTINNTKKKKKKGSPKLSVALDHVSDEYPRFSQVFFIQFSRPLPC